MSVLYQATGVAIGGRAVLITGAAGSGKSSLALALIDRGARLIGDDGVLLEVAGDHLLASPAPHTAGLLEVRNVGIVTRPTLSRVTVALVLHLDAKAPRFVDAAEQTQIEGIGLPLIRLWPNSPVLHLRAELALERHGLG
ncbi:MAG: HPr kinase/phosphatase C-terminal domain-containing protein [Novosphingobium sp.]